MNTLDGERVITSIEVYKEVSDLEAKKNLIGNIVVGLLAGGLGGEVPVNFNLILTEKHLCIEAIVLSAWGRLPETQYIEKIALDELEGTKVVSKEGTDFITIYIKDKKALVFKRKNEIGDNFAYELEKLITKMLS